jgi:hypothetical protein
METKIINAEETNITENTASVLTLAAECNSTPCDTCNNSNCDGECNCNCDGATTGGTCGEETTSKPTYIENAEIISVGEVKTVCSCCAEADSWFKFTPSVGGKYAVLLNGSTGVIGCIYDSNLQLTEHNIVTKDDIISSNLVSGKTYYIRTYANEASCIYSVALIIPISTITP